MDKASRIVPAFAIVLACSSGGEHGATRDAGMVDAGLPDADYSDSPVHGWLGLNSWQNVDQAPLLQVFAFQGPPNRVIDESGPCILRVADDYNRGLKEHIGDVMFYLGEDLSYEGRYIAGGDYVHVTLDPEVLVAGHELRATATGAGGVSGFDESVSIPEPLEGEVVGADAIVSRSEYLQAIWEPASLDLNSEVVLTAYLSGFEIVCRTRDAAGEVNLPPILWRGLDDGDLYVELSREVRQQVGQDGVALWVQAASRIGYSTTLGP